MAESDLTVKIDASLKTYTPGQTSPGSTDPVSAEITSQKRIRDQVVEIAGGGTATLDLSTEGLSASAILKMECLTAGMDFNIINGADTVGIDVVSPSSTTKAWFLGTLNFTSLTITNPDASTSIRVQYSVFEKVT